MSDVVVIGAGPAGLSAAYELSQCGSKTLVLEADEQVGGLSRTVNYRGYRFDIGGHRFFSKIPLINEMWHEILGEDLRLQSRLSRIHYRGHFFDYPLQAFNALTGLGPVEAFLVGLSYARAKVAPQRQETTFEQWVSNRFGSRLYFSLRPIRKKCGACPARKYRQTGRRSGSRICHSVRPCVMLIWRSAGDGWPGDYHVDRPVLLPPVRTRYDVGTL
jgi:hypothetical protein